MISLIFGDISLLILGIVVGYCVFRNNTYLQKYYDIVWAWIKKIMVGK